jgi:rubrerythrin
MMDLSELTDKISALKVLKEQINIAIRDEQEAQAIYDKMTSLAGKARSASARDQIHEIRGQEHTHEIKFKSMLKDTEQSIIEYERMMKEEQKKQAEEKRRKEKEVEEQRRKASDRANKIIQERGRR